MGLTLVRTQSNWNSLTSYYPGHLNVTRGKGTKQKINWLSKQMMWGGGINRREKKEYSRGKKKEKSCEQNRNGRYSPSSGKGGNGVTPGERKQPESIKEDYLQDKKIKSVMSRRVRLSKIRKKRKDTDYPKKVKKDP